MGRWLDDLALWARRRDLNSELTGFVTGLVAPELTSTQMLGLAQMAEIAGVAASTLRAYFSRGEAEVPQPQAVIGGRSLWARPIAEEWRKSAAPPRTASRRRWQTPHRRVPAPDRQARRSGDRPPHQGHEQPRAFGRKVTGMRQGLARRLTASIAVRPTADDAEATSYRMLLINEPEAKQVGIRMADTYQDRFKKTNEDGRFVSRNRRPGRADALSSSRRHIGVDRTSRNFA